VYQRIALSPGDLTREKTSLPVCAIGSLSARVFQVSGNYLGPVLRKNDIAGGVARARYKEITAITHVYQRRKLESGYA
jgi:hypothetical protein